LKNKKNRDVSLLSLLSSYKAKEVRSGSNFSIFTLPKQALARVEEEK